MARYFISKTVWSQLTDQERVLQHGNVDLGWWVRRDRSDFAFMLKHYADAYIDGGSILLETFLAQAGYSDAEALPILYMFSHFVELGLKACHEYKRLILKDSARVFVERHQVSHVLSDVLRDLESLFEGSEGFLSSDTQKFIMMLDGLNLGAAFRYPYNTKGKPAWTDTPPIPMRIFKHQVEVHCRELQSLYYRLAEEYSAEPNEF